ncbi:DNA-directed RNA polymerase, subunit E'' [Candidatus Woesearchaeota archaeon]|nr:DNA-directed RNA polymerase, subunit E'' [Candidatus Woesearchaeota archaeon]
MSKKKACKTCRYFVHGDVCPICKSTNFTDSWQGRVFINDPQRSFIAEKIGVKQKGEYALKVR